MANLVFTPEGGSPIPFLAAVAADFLIAGKSWDKAPIPGAFQQDWQDIEAPGADGMDSRPLGLRKRTVGPFRVTYKASTALGCVQAFEADHTAMQAVAITVAHPAAGSLSNCKLASNGAQASGYPTPNPAGTMFWMQVVYLLEQLSG